DPAERRLDDALHQPQGQKKDRRHEHVVVQRVAQVDAEKRRWRDAGHAVLAAGDARPLVGDEIEELVQREGQHDEVKARALDAQVAHQEGRHGADADAYAERGENADAVILEQVSRDIGGGAEEGRLAEGEEAGIAEQQVQAQAEDREDPDFACDRRAHDERQHADGSEDENGRSHRMPNMPCGRTSRTSAMTAKITAVEASVQYAATTACAMPIKRPAAIAPSRLPKPPSATTTKAIPSMSTPMPGERPRIGAVSAPAMPAR